MRRSTRIFLAALVAATVFTPASGAVAQECGALAGVARLQIFDTPVGGLIGQGTAVVRFDGAWQITAFDETSIVDTGPGTADVTHIWHFAEGDATFLEHSTTSPLGANLLRFRSSVDVTPGGTAFYNGIFNLSTRVAWFVVRGNICVGE